MIHGGKHVRVYDKYFEIGPHNRRRCEISGTTRMADVTHIDASGMGGRDSVHVIENLMCLRRDLHELFGDKSEYKDQLREVHAQYMEDRIPLYKRNPHHPLMWVVYNQPNFKGFR